MTIWIAIGLALACAGFSIAFSAVFVWKLRKRVRELELSSARERESVQTALKLLEATVNEVSEQLRDAGEQAAMLPLPATPRPALNLGKRSQALRLHRHGETPERIASNLELPKAEVNLLLKVHRLALKLS